MRCDPTVLWTLVEQSHDPGDEASGLLDHVERCPDCQATLRSIGGNESWWSNVQKWLGSAKDGSGIAAETNGLTESTALDVAILQPPKHPEMLGRLGRYDIEGVIGRGGMGVVFRGFDSDLQRCVAIKILSPRHGYDATARQRFAREAQAAASVVHENVIPIFNVEAEHDPPFFVMPFIAGATLEQFVKRHGCPDAITVLRIARQIVNGLHAAHQQDLIHRDIKPGNILVTENVHRVWITDFGLARAVDNATVTHSGLIAGTPQFMSPEQSRGQRLDARSDLFSFGALLYFLSTGRPPFEGDSTLAVLHQVAATDPPSLAELRPDLPPAFVSLIDNLLCKQPSRRPSDAGAVAKRLSRAIAEVTSGMSMRSIRRRQRNQRYIGAVAAAVMLLGTVAGGYRWFPHVSREIAAPAPAVPGMPEAPVPGLAEMVQKIEVALTRPEADAAIYRFRREVARLEQQSPTASGTHLDPLHRATGPSQAEVTAVAGALEHLEGPEAGLPWDIITTDPTQRLADEILQLSQQSERLHFSPGEVP